MSSFNNKIILLFFMTKVVVNCKLLFSTATVFNTSTNDENDEIERGLKSEERINLSYPGTKWCGPGNTAHNYDHLGEHSETDMCCRDHDHCDNIGAGETKYNLTNNDIFTILHCKCDQEFSDCLHKTDSETSNHIGYTYFTVRNKCYKNEYPIIECQKYDYRFFLRRCGQYLLDMSKPKIYQMFDLPFYGSMEDLNKCKN